MGLSEESGRVDLLVATEAGGSRGNLFRQIHAVEGLRDLIGLRGHVDVLKEIGIDGLGDEPGVDQGNLIIGIVGVVCHFQVNLPVLPGLAGVKHVRSLGVERLDVLDGRGIHDDDIHVFPERDELLFLNGLDARGSKIGDGVKIIGNADLSKKLTVKVTAFSAAAKEKIEAAGGTAETIG
jgi:hypothetical protein